MMWQGIVIQSKVLFHGNCLLFKLNLEREGNDNYFSEANFACKKSCDFGQKKCEIGHRPLVIPYVAVPIYLGVDYKL